MKDIIKEFEKIRKIEEEFINKKKYINVIEEVLNKNIDTDPYEEPKVWTEDVDLLFNFLYDNACEISILGQDFDGTIYIKYKDKYISLFEIHGQGCYRRISTLDNKPVDFINFDDIVAYVENGIKPERVKILELVNLALDSMGFISEGLNLDIDIEYVKQYLRENLE